MAFTRFPVGGPAGGAHSIGSACGFGSVLGKCIPALACAGGLRGVTACFLAHLTGTVLGAAPGGALTHVPGACLRLSMLALLVGAAWDRDRWAGRGACFRPQGTPPAFPKVGSRGLPSGNRRVLAAPISTAPRTFQLFWWVSRLDCGCNLHSPTLAKPRSTPLWGAPRSPLRGVRSGSGPFFGWVVVLADVWVSCPCCGCLLPPSACVSPPSLRFISFF